MDEAGRAYESEMKRIAAAGMPGIVRGAPTETGASHVFTNMVGQWGPADPGYAVPKPPSGLNTPVQSASHRIAELAKQVTEAGHMLAEARAQHRNASISREKCEMQFAQVSDALVQAMSEHREGHSVAGLSTASTSPEGVPYQP